MTFVFHFYYEGVDIYRFRPMIASFASFVAPPEPRELVFFPGFWATFATCTGDSVILKRFSSLLDHIGRRTLELVFTPTLSTLSHPSWISPTALGIAARRLASVCSDEVWGGVAIRIELDIDRFVDNDSPG